MTTLTTPPAQRSEVEGTYDVAGPPERPAIVFVHGTRLTGAMWAPQLADLGAEFRVVALDLPGHGRSAGTPFTLEGAADRLAAVIDEAGSGSAIVVGLSLGGYVAMTLAARSPGRVRGLVLAGATAEPIGPWRMPYLALATAMDRFDGRRLDALNRWFFQTRFRPSLAEPIVAGGFWSRAGAAALRSLANERFAPRLAAYPGPVLILNGSLDVPFRLGASRFARAAEGHVRRVRLAGATHLANLDRPEAFSEAVRRFARSLDEADRPDRD